MLIMQENRKKIAKLVMVVFPLLALLIYINKDFLIQMTEYFPVCYFYEKTGYLCAACGNTRSVIYLLKGEILESMRYNITPFVLLVIVFGFYFECVFFVFGHTVQIIPRKRKYLFMLLASMCIYYFSRNLFL